MGSQSSEWRLIAASPCHDEGDSVILCDLQSEDYVHSHCCCVCLGLAQTDMTVASLTYVFCVVCVYNQFSWMLFGVP
jgi:hypothetical protein